MSWLERLFGNKPKSAQVAKERLQVIIARERSDQSGPADFLPALQQELVAVISKYVKVNQDDIKVSLSDARKAVPEDEFAGPASPDRRPRDPRC